MEHGDYIKVLRPRHKTGIPYDQKYYTVEVTEEGQALVDAYPDLWPEECN